MLLATFAAALLSLAAGQTPVSRSWEILHSGLDAETPEVRQQAVVALGSIEGSRDVTRLLEHALEDKDALVRAAAAASLGSLKAGTAIPALRKAVDDEDDVVSFTAAKVLWDMGDRGAGFVLEEVLTHERSPAEGGVSGAVHSMEKRIHNPAQLAKMGINAASGFLLGPYSIGIVAAEDIAKDSGATGRGLAAAMLAEHCDAGTRKLFEDTLASESNWAVKTAIARGLGKCGTRESVATFEPYLSDSTKDGLRFMSAAAIIRLSRPAARRTGR